MSTSKLQRATRERLRVLLNSYELIENAHPDWLVNPVTGRRLELDLYLPEVNIAIEVQGQQHFAYTPMFHASPDDFEAQKQRDNIKRDLCEKRGVALYEISCPAEIETLLDKMAEYSPEMAKELHKKFTAILSCNCIAGRMIKHRRSYPHDRQSIEAWQKKIMHMAEKYNIPLDSIEPDENLDNIDIAFAGKQIVRVMWVKRGVKKLEEKAAVMSVINNTAYLRFLPRRAGVPYLDMQLDLVTGNLIGCTEREDWRIRAADLEKLRQRARLQGYQNREG